MMDTLKDKLESKRLALARVTDRLGMPIDAGILDTVAALQLLGFATKGSCEGHVGRGLPWPWVDVCPGDRQPDMRWEGEADVRAQIQTELGLTDADVLVKDNGQKVAPREFNQRLFDWVDNERPRETEAYVVWCDGFHLHYVRLLALIRRFEQQEPDDTFLTLTLNGLGTGARLAVVDTFSYRDKSFKRDIQDKAMTDRLVARQARMRAFTGFLMEEIR